MNNPSNRRPMPFNRLRGAAVATLCALPLLSCTDGVTGPSDLVGVVWTLESMERAGSPLFVPDRPQNFTVEFKADGQIGVKADCNSCGGTYTLNGDQLIVPGMACTLALCAKPGGWEFQQLIEGNTSVDKDGDTLEIASMDGRLKLKR